MLKHKEDPPQVQDGMLGIAVEKVCDFILRAREFASKVDVVEPDPGSNMSDEDFRAVLEDYGDDAVYQELCDFVAALNEEEQANLVALAWLGRGAFGPEEWDEAIAEARRNQDKDVADYLLGMPHVSDHLEEGLAAHGQSCVD